MNIVYAYNRHDNQKVNDGLSVELAHLCDVLAEQISELSTEIETHTHVILINLSDKYSASELSLEHYFPSEQIISKGLIVLGLPDRLKQRILEKVNLDDMFLELTYRIAQRFGE